MKPVLSLQISISAEVLAMRWLNMRGLVEIGVLAWFDSSCCNETYFYLVLAHIRPTKTCDGDLHVCHAVIKGN